MIVLERDADASGDERSGVLDAIAGVPGIVVGWRTWTVDGEQLCSVDGGASWPAGRPRVAACRTTRHVAPAAGCDCGVLATTESGLSGTADAGMPTFVGLVAVWGRIEPGPGPATGWRAKRGYPVVLIADDRTAPALRRAVASAYGVPVFRTDGDLGALFDDRDRRIVLQTIRCRLEELLRADPPPEPDEPVLRIRAVVELVESVVSAWSAAETWRHEATGRLPAVPTAPTPAPVVANPVPTPAPAAPTSLPTPVPDVAGIVVAWRSWQLTGGELTSVTRPDVWPGTEAMVGRCAAGGHAAPHESCGCGVYAARAIDYAGRYHYGGTGTSVMGCVALWGRIVEATFGWRAEKAYPTVLFVASDVPVSTRASLARRYRVPVHAIPHGDRGWWSEPAITRTAETVRATLERHHGQVSHVDVSAAVDAMITTAGTGRGTWGVPRSSPLPLPAPRSGGSVPAAPVVTGWSTSSTAGATLAPPALPPALAQPRPAPPLPHAARTARAVLLAFVVAVAVTVVLLVV